MTQLTHDAAIACCPNSGVWYLWCPACERVSVMTRDAVCRFCGAENSPREVSREEFFKRTNVRL